MWIDLTKEAGKVCLIQKENIILCTVRPVDDKGQTVKSGSKILPKAYSADILCIGGTTVSVMKPTPAEALQFLKDRLDIGL